MKLLRKIKRISIFIIVLVVSYSCSEINFELPQGPQGPQGLSTYEIWKVQVEEGAVNWPKDKTEVEDFMVYIKGEKGDRGDDGKSAYELWKELISTGEVNNPHNPKEKWNKDRNTESDFWDFLTGRDGISPHIGDNGNWWIGYIDTKVPAKGQDGKDGKDGITPHIGQNGNWWIGITDTQVPAKGQDGKDGVTPHIGSNGNWWIGTIDTRVPAKGQDGKDGLSAYESWKQLAVTGNLDDPKNPGQKWPADKVEVVHFIQYLTGANGKDGINGFDGNDGADGQTPYIGSNGNWWIGSIDTRVPAKGQDGIDGFTPYIGDNGNWWIDGTDTGKPSRGDNGKDGTSPHIGDNGNWWIGTSDTGKPSRGDNGNNGTSPHIGSNGNWWIGTTDTGVPAKGQDGQDGVSPHVGSNGNWWIGTTDTGVPARGQDGTNGSDGKSAYELWVDDVKKGVIKDPDTGQVWPITEITQADFWRYLKGKDGKDGQDGQDGQNGVNGKSAYEIWKEIAETGNLDNPKNPGQKWPSNETAETDFWVFLMGKDGANGKDGINGKDGQSAYELWVEEVKNGLKNPHDEEGGDWPKDKTSTGNFWEYLSGKDGIDGQDGTDGKPGEPGEPGYPVEIIKGIPNVIVQYSLQEYSEYVRWSDGSVVYIVYNDQGTPSPGAIVKGMPGVDPNKEYTSDAEGQFIVPKEDLPEGKPIEELVGKTTSVTYTKSDGATVTETSAPNTYVPNRIHTRLVSTKSQHKIYLGYENIGIDFQMQRNIGTPNATWQNIPAHLGYNYQSYDALRVSDKDDPTSTINSSYGSASRRASESATISIKRPRIKPYFYKKVTEEWNGEDYYFVIKTSYNGLYGENPRLPMVIKNAPIQFMPIIKEIYDVKTYGEAFNAVAELSVKLDASHINPQHFYKYSELTRKVAASDGLTYEYWEPIVAEAGTYNLNDIFTIKFRYILSGTGDLSVDNSKNKSSLNQLTSKLNNVVVESDVSLNCNFSVGVGDIVSPYFVRPLEEPTIGKLSYNKENNTLNFISNKDNKQDIPDILNIPITQ